MKEYLNRSREGRKGMHGKDAAHAGQFSGAQSMLRRLRSSTSRASRLLFKLFIIEFQQGARSEKNLNRSREDRKGVLLFRRRR